MKIKRLILEEIESLLTEDIVLENFSLHEEQIVEDYIEEGGYAKMVRSIAGLEPNIDSIGIITAENPMAQKHSSKENKVRNSNLAEDLRSLGYGFYQIQGKYGNIEHPFVVPNVLKDDIVNLGEKYGQDAIIYVFKTKTGSVAEMIETHDANKTVVSKVVLPMAHDVEDFYSIYKGRKFSIPFFDDMFRNKALVRGRLVDID